MIEDGKTGTIVPFDNNQEIDIHTYDSVLYDRDFGKNKEEEVRLNVIRPPKMPNELANALDRMMTI